MDIQSSKTPLVTVITPAYNCADFITDTIHSVQVQTYTNWEMIIVDDQSKDNTREVLQQFASEDQRIKPIFLEKNSGAAVARNTAIQAANGKYVAFLDSDDQWLPHKLEKHITFMEQNDYAFTYSNYRVMHQDGTKSNTVIHVPKQVNYKQLLKTNVIGCLTAVVNIEKTGPIEMPNIRTRQDFALWLSILKRGFTAYGLQEELALYRKVDGSISSNKIKMAKQNWLVYREIEKMSLLPAIWVFIHYAWNGFKKSKVK